MMNTMIRTLVAEGRTFTIVHSAEYNKYLAIEDKYITDGKLNQQLNGFQMHASDTVDECVNITIMSCRIDRMKAEGMSEQDIMSEIANWAMAMA